jgi:cell division protease FtsH
MQFPNDKKDDNKTPDDPKPPQSPLPPDWQKWLLPAMVIFILFWMLLQLGGLDPLGTQSVEIAYSVLYEEALDGNVDQVTISGTAAKGTFRNPVTVEDDAGSYTSSRTVMNFSTTIPINGHDQLHDALVGENTIRKADVNYKEPETSLTWLLIQFLPLLFLIGFFVWMVRRAQRQMNGAMSFGRTQAREYDVERPQVTFEDVAGQDAAKTELVEIIDFLSEPDKYIALGARIPRGVLLIGPPGTGKTLMARAVAGEAGVSFFSITASEFVEMFVGVGASRVRDLFKRAKENSPSIVFIDELDAVGRRRGAGLGGGNDEREQTLNQMLAEMDGFDQNESVIVMAATNRNDVLDPALLRPGRFDRQVTVGLPDRTGRFEIMKIHTRGKPLDNDVNLEFMARGTIGFSGADLANLANEAALNAARRNVKKVSMRDFSVAFDRIVLGTERPPLSDPRERKVVAYHEAGHALIATLLPEADPVLKVTIVPRGQALGITAQMPVDDRRNYSKRYLDSRLLVLLGGRAAEQIIFDDITTGAENDLRNVTELARRMVAQFGMSEAIGQLNFGDDATQPFLGYSLSQGRNYSEETAAKIDAEVRQLVDASYTETVELIEANLDKLNALAQALLENEIVEQAEMLQIMGIDIADNTAADDDSQRDHFASGKHEETNGENNDNGANSTEDAVDNLSQEEEKGASSSSL